MTRPNSDSEQPFAFLIKLAKNAFRLEWQTEAGRVNFLGMVLALIVVVIMTAANIPQWVAETVLRALSMGDGPSSTNPIDVLWIFLVWTLGCVAMLGLLVIRARKEDPPREQ